MESRFYHYRGTIEVNVPLLSRSDMGVRFTLRQGNVYATIEVTNKELSHADDKIYQRVFDELCHRLQGELKKRAPQEKTMCSTCIKRDVDCSCDCVREYRKRDE